MKYTFISMLTVMLALTCSESRAQRVVILGLDGFSTEGFRAARHPNIDKLFSQGVLSLSTRPVMPSVTLPNWTSHLTGSGPEEHGVTSNAWTVQKHQLKALTTDEDGYYPSIFKVLKDKKNKVKTAFFYNWAELINSINRKYLDEASFEENDGYMNNYRKAVDFIKTNKNSPQLVFLYSVHTDHAGHKYKWMSPQYIQAIEEADAAIGGFIQQLKDKNLFNETYFMLITDHGGLEYGHGGTTMHEMQIPWAATGPGIKQLGSIDNMYNSNRNTSIALAHIFGIKDLPACWSGQLLKGIFK